MESLVLFPYFWQQPGDIVRKHRMGRAGLNEFVCTCPVQIDRIQYGVPPVVVAAQHAEHHACQHIARAAFGQCGIACWIVKPFAVGKSDRGARAF